MPASLRVPGGAPALPWPVLGQGAVSVPALGFAQQSGPESPVPIASLTKMANAIVILHDHPLATDSDGPTITITQADAAQYGVDLDNDESSIPIQPGETLTERQMLEALMNQSANDIAYTLAVWDAGNELAFVAKMNALAASLGATHTHYADASGYDPQSESTASDCLRIAAAGMRIPAFAQIVGLRTVTLPLVGTVQNVVTQIGSDGVVGVKSGYTSEAKACMVLAGYRVIDGRTVLVLASVVGQHVPTPVAPKPTGTTDAPGSRGSPAPHAGSSTSTTTTTVPVNGLELMYPLRYAGPIVEKLLDVAEAAVVAVPVVTRDQPLVSVAAAWGGALHRVGVIASRGAWLLGWPGQRVASALRLGTVPAGARAGSPAGDALYALGEQIESVPLTTTGTVPEPSWEWRLVHG